MTERPPEPPVAFPLMTQPSKTAIDERKRLQLQAVPFALPDRRKEPSDG